VARLLHLRLRMCRLRLGSASELAKMARGIAIQHSKYVLNVSEARAVLTELRLRRKVVSRKFRYEHDGCSMIASA
jgi:hypothetical protein